jgi:hypothetical protein
LIKSEQRVNIKSILKLKKAATETLKLFGEDTLSRALMSVWHTEVFRRKEKRDCGKCRTIWPFGNDEN